MTAPGPGGEAAVPVRQDLVEFEQMLGGDTIRAVPQGTVEFGRPLAYEIGLECFPPGFRALSDAGDWRYVRVVLPVTIGLLPGRRELTAMTVSSAGPPRTRWRWIWSRPAGSAPTACRRCSARGRSA